jgi:hypothetical protein
MTGLTYMDEPHKVEVLLEILATFRFINTKLSLLIEYEDVLYTKTLHIIFDRALHPFPLPSKF